MSNPLMKTLKQTWEENPLGVVAAGASAIAAFAKLVDVTSSAQSRRAYAKAEKRRRKLNRH